MRQRVFKGAFCKTIYTFSVCKLLIFSAAAQSVSKVWVADRGDGSYKNPVLHADYSDPDVIRRGDTYYLVASSLHCLPGLPILESKDLVNWQIVNYAVKRLEPETVYQAPQHGKGIWAPALRYHNGEFYIFYPDPDYGIFMIKTKNPRKDWSKPLLVLPGKGTIDPCPLWDNDGKAYLVVAYAASRAGFNSVLTLYRLSPDGKSTLGEGRHIYDGHGVNHTIEGPKLYKANGYYYIFSPAGGVSTGWQVVLRSKNIYGPYEARTVLHEGNSNINGPHQGAWVRTASGKSWFLHFQDKGAYGRVLYLEPMKWKAGWPLIGTDMDGDGIGEPVLSYRKPEAKGTGHRMTPPEDDEFNSADLGKQWQWQANPSINWYALLPGSGHLRLFAFPQEKPGAGLWGAPNLLLQKFPAPAFTVTSSVKFYTEWDVYQSKRAGLVVMGNTYASVYLAQDSAGYNISMSICRNADAQGTEQVVASRRLQKGTAFLRMTVTAPNASCQFFYSEDGMNYEPLGPDFLATPDKWVGAKVGIFSVSDPGVRIGGYADFDWFRISPLP